MPELIGICIALGVFVGLPGYLITIQYGFALGLSAALLGIVMLSIFYLLQEIRDLLKQSNGES